MPPKRSPRKPEGPYRSVQAFPGEAVPFPDFGAQEMVEPWAGGIDESVPLDSPAGAPTTSPRPGAPARGAPWGAMLCDWLLFGVSGASHPPAGPQDEPAAWTGMGAGREAAGRARSATPGSPDQRFVFSKASVRDKGLAAHLEDHLNRCRLAQQNGELLCLLLCLCLCLCQCLCLYLDSRLRLFSGPMLTALCLGVTGGSGPQGIGEHIAKHKENVQRAAT